MLVVCYIHQRQNDCSLHSTESQHAKVTTWPPCTQSRQRMQAPGVRVCTKAASRGNVPVRQTCRQRRHALCTPLNQFYQSLQSIGHGPVLVSRLLGPLDCVLQLPSATCHAPAGLVSLEQNPAWYLGAPGSLSSQRCWLDSEGAPVVPPGGPAGCLQQSLSVSAGPSEHQQKSDETLDSFE